MILAWQPSEVIQCNKPSDLLALFRVKAHCEPTFVPVCLIKLLQCTSEPVFVRDRLLASENLLIALFDLAAFV